VPNTTNEFAKIAHLLGLANNEPDDVTELFEGHDQPHTDEKLEDLAA
jgi:hypothetical protein